MYENSIACGTVIFYSDAVSQELAANNVTYVFRIDHGQTVSNDDIHYPTWVYLHMTVCDSITVIKHMPKYFKRQLGALITVWHNCIR